jgi:type II secretory pathway pseudopilin PulG
VATFGLALIGAVVALAFINNFRSIAVRNEKKAEEAAQMARAGELVAQGQVEYEENPLLGLQLALEGLLIVPESEETRLKDLTLRANDLALQGRLLKLGNDVKRIFAPEIENRDWFNNVERIFASETQKPDWFIVDYAEKPGELKTFKDGELVTTLTGNVDDVYSSPDYQWFVVNYYDAPGELRRSSEPETVIELTGDVVDVTFSPDNQWFVARYTMLPASYAGQLNPK